MAENNNNHLLVTEPDRVRDRAFCVLLIDFEPQMVETMVTPLQGCKTDLTIYVYNEQDNNARWLLDVANEADLILIDTYKTTKNDVFKGYLLPLKTTWFVGRPDLGEFWPRYTTDALGTILVNIQKHIDQEE